MSHFCCLVITNNRPSYEDLTRILQPWHEFECTGTDDEYILDVDDTEELRVKWRSDTTTRYRDPDGDLHDPYEDRFYRDPTPEEEQKAGGGTGAGGGLSWTSKDWGDGRGYRSKVHFVPDGWEEVTVPISEVRSFREFVSYYTSRKEVLPGGRAKFGFTEITDDLDRKGEVIRTVDRTNPNKKWDWWVVGGRWSGHLRVKPGIEVVKGDKGLMDSCASDAANASDQATIAEIDLEGMRQEAREKFGERWDKVHAATAGMDQPMPFEAVRIRYRPENLEAARNDYWAQPAMAALKAAFPDSWGLDEELRALGMSRDAYCEAGAFGALTSFAVVKDGRWYERGKMGWWAVVADEKDKGDWDRQFNALLDDLPPEACLTVVDCHI